MLGFFTCFCSLLVFVILTTQCIAWLEVNVGCNVTGEFLLITQITLPYLTIMHKILFEIFKNIL